MPTLSLDLDTTAADYPAEAGERRDGGTLAHDHAPRRRSWFAELILAPFQDIDERVRVKA